MNTKSLVLLLVASFTIACGEKSTDTNATEDTDTEDTGTEPDGASCTADLTLSFPDGSSSTLDFCQEFSLEAVYEFDPDEAPEIRNPYLLLKATTDTSFDCWVEIREPNACGEGYYLMDGSSGSVTYATWDCSNVGNDYEGEYSSAAGYVQLTHLYAGDEPGNFSGEPLLTTMDGVIQVESAEGISLSGDFSMSQWVVADDAETLVVRRHDIDRPREQPSEVVLCTGSRARSTVEYLGQNASKLALRRGL